MARGSREGPPRCWRALPTRKRSTTWTSVQRPVLVHTQLALVALSRSGAPSRGRMGPRRKSAGLRRAPRTRGTRPRRRRDGAAPINAARQRRRALWRRRLPTPSATPGSRSAALNQRPAGSVLGRCALASSIGLRLRSDRGVDGADRGGDARLRPARRPATGPQHSYSTRRDCTRRSDRSRSRRWPARDSVVGRPDRDTGAVTRASRLADRAGDGRSR